MSIGKSHWYHFSVCFCACDLQQHSVVVNYMLGFVLSYVVMHNHHQIVDLKFVDSGEEVL